MSLSLKEAEELIKLARKAVFEKKIFKTDKFKEKKGVFVTLLDKNEELRGCIGFIEPVYSLGEGIQKAAYSAAYQDPRFMPVGENEELVFEISILTEPKEIEIKSEKDFNKIRIGKDGLIVEKGFNKGLLLPQVATKFGWNEKEFLEHTCMKAGLSKGDWDMCKVFKFQVELFKEKDGGVERV